LRAKAFVGLFFESLGYYDRARTVLDADQSVFLQATVGKRHRIQVYAEIRGDLPDRWQESPFFEFPTRNQRLYLIDELLIQRPRISFINRNEHIV
jgi:hypothetical protein